MRKTIDLNAELREWLSMRLSEVLAKDPESVYYVKMNIHEAKDDIMQTVYDYQLIRGWKHVAENTATIIGYDHRSINKMLKKRIGKTKRN